MQHRDERTLTLSARIRRGVTMITGILLVSLGLVAMAAPSNAEGNNGTVKIDGWTLDHGNGSGAPNGNEPHVDCDFDIEWYNFDAGVTSTVTFEMQAPTASVGLSGTAPSSVLLDDDDATGANAAGLDAVQHYTLAFDGAAHPQHGYHVKLTVNTPTSNGADVKHKVFWVEGCENEPSEIPLPEPGVEDPCGTNNASWIVPGDTETLDWELADNGDLVVTILAEDTVFAGTGETTHNYGPPEETNTDYCPKEEVDLPAEPEVYDPCDPGNAEWVVPEDTEVLDWELTENGDLVVSIIPGNTVFTGTKDTTHNFGQPEETNTEACPSVQPEDLVREVAGVQASCKLGGVKTWVDVYTTPYVWDEELGDWVLGEETGPVRTEETFVKYTAAQLERKCAEVKGEQENKPPKNQPAVEVKGEQASVPSAVDAGLADAAPSGGASGWGLLSLGAGLALIGMSVSRRRGTATRR